jgi:hypothetical protein
MPVVLREVFNVVFKTPSADEIIPMESHHIA